MDTLNTTNPESATEPDAVAMSELVTRFCADGSSNDASPSTCHYDHEVVESDSFDEDIDDFRFNYDFNIQTKLFPSLPLSISNFCLVIPGQTVRSVYGPCYGRVSGCSNTDRIITKLTYCTAALSRYTAFRLLHRKTEGRKKLYFNDCTVRISASTQTVRSRSRIVRPGILKLTRRLNSNKTSGRKHLLDCICPIDVKLPRTINRLMVVIRKRIESIARRITYTVVNNLIYETKSDKLNTFERTSYLYALCMISLLPFSACIMHCSNVRKIRVPGTEVRMRCDRSIDSSLHTKASQNHLVSSTKLSLLLFLYDCAS